MIAAALATVTTASAAVILPGLRYYVPLTQLREPAYADARRRTARGEPPPSRPGSQNLAAPLGALPARCSARKSRSISPVPNDWWFLWHPVITFQVWVSV
jgi:hypothetical protein